MTGDARIWERACPDCQAINAATDDCCWLCKRNLAPESAAQKISTDPSGNFPVNSSGAGQRQATAATEHAADSWGGMDASMARGEVVPNMPPQFGLSSLLLAITAICLVLGVLAAAPGLAIPLLMVVAPALIRTFVAAKQAGESSSVSSKIVAFVASLGIVILILFAGAAAFFVACTMILFGSGPSHESELWVVTGVLIVPAMLFLYYVTMPKKKR